MIRVFPQLPATFQNLSGSLIEISPRELIVRWPDHRSLDSARENSKSSNHLTVRLGQNNPVNIEIDSHHQIDRNGETLTSFRAAHASAHNMQDLLHILRKSQHISICANEDVEHSGRDHGFKNIELPIVSFPERSFAELSTDRRFLNRRFSSPLLITGMTGGVAQATLINERLARAASFFNIPMGVGSQRIALENPEHAGIFNVKRQFPKLFLVGNIGIGQLARDDYFDQCQRAVEMIQADALAIHVNVLQELIQCEGDRNFKGLLEKIINIHQNLQVPIIVKEVGAGLDHESIKTLYTAGIRAFDVGGSGGTSWAHIEGLRSSDPWVRRRGEIFRDWGLSTSTATINARKVAPHAEIIATGGIRDGLTVLKALHVGATMTGIGLPLMRAALQDDEAPLSLLDSILAELKIALMCSGLTIGL